MTMDEKQIREIAKVIFQMMKEKQIEHGTGTAALPIAYVLLSERWKEYDFDLSNDIIESLKGKYQCVLVFPDGNDGGKFRQAVNCNIVNRGDVAEPAAGSISIFPFPCRDLIIKTALCLSDDYDSRWVRMCFEKGTPVHMRKEALPFTGKESAVYRNRVLAYYKEVESYGVHFLESGKLDIAALKYESVGEKQDKPGRYITMEDLDSVDITKVFRMHKGDTFTALAKEYIEELGIRVIVE